MKRMLFVIGIVAAAVMLVSCVFESQNTELSQTGMEVSVETASETAPSRKYLSEDSFRSTEEEKGMLEPTTIQDEDEAQRNSLPPYVEPTSRSVDEAPELLPLEEPSGEASDEALNESVNHE